MNPEESTGLQSEQSANVSDEHLEQAIKKLKELIIKHTKSIHKLKNPRNVRNPMILEKLNLQRTIHRDKIEKYKKQIIQFEQSFPEGYNKVLDMSTEE